jgi:hypothetical protein
VTSVGLVLGLRSCCFLRQARAATIAAGVNRHQNDRITISNQALTSELASAVCVAPISSYCHSYREEDFS